jgi:hypothetical protein
MLSVVPTAIAVHTTKDHSDVQEPEQDTGHQYHPLPHMVNFLSIINVFFLTVDTSPGVDNTLAM